MAVQIFLSCKHRVLEKACANATPAKHVHVAGEERREQVRKHGTHEIVFSKLLFHTMST